MVEFANTIEQEQAPTGNLAHITGFASKAAEQAARVAGILTTFDDEHAQTISLAATQCSTRIIEWYLCEAQRLLDGAEVNRDIGLAQTLLDWLWLHRPNEPFSRRCIVRNGPPKIRDTALVLKLLRILAEHRQIRRSAATEVDGTRTKEAWELRHV